MQPQCHRGMKTFKQTWIAILPVPLSSPRKSDAKSATQNRRAQLDLDKFTEDVLASLRSAGLLSSDARDANGKAARIIRFALHCAALSDGVQDMNRLDWLENYFPPLDPLTKKRIKRNWRTIIDAQMKKMRHQIKEANVEKYRRLKAEMLRGVQLSREDFLFVKGRDWLANNQRKKMRADGQRTSGGGIDVCGGYNTAPR